VIASKKIILFNFKCC